MPQTRRRIAMLSGVFLALTLVAPVTAGGPVISTWDDEKPDAPAPTGSSCDILLSTLDGPFVDDNFQIRAYEDFIVWGFDYPANSSVTIEFDQGTGILSFEANIDADGTFAEGFFFAPYGSSPLWQVRARHSSGCVDQADIAVLPPHPFSDAIRHAFEREISWLFREEITGGCTATRFCPANGVTRGQMAAFLNRALNLPATATDFFDDDDGTIFEGDINRLANAGITGGCATRRFCQDAMVTREQMASFLARALSLPATSTDAFTDDESSIHEGAINRLAAAGVTGGCTVTTFCPRSQVTRGQMAAFLYRGLAE